MSAVGTRRASRQDLQRRHQLLVVATGWGRRTTFTTLLRALRDGLDGVRPRARRSRPDRAGAILGSWRWLFRQPSAHSRAAPAAPRDPGPLRRRTAPASSRWSEPPEALLLHLAARRTRPRTRDPARPDAALDDHDVDASTASGFACGLLRRGGVRRDPRERHARTSPPSVSVADVVSLPGRARGAVVVVLWLIGSRNLVATHLPLVGRLAPLDSWWTTWRHFFASWSTNGVGTRFTGHARATR